MQDVHVDSVLSELRRRHPRYGEPAYLFILSALQRCVAGLRKPRHVSGAELSEAVRALALERFGPLARTVLGHWGLHSTADVGEVVFALVDCGILIKQPGDSREDFVGLYSFEEAFETSYPWGASR